MTDVEALVTAARGGDEVAFSRLIRAEAKWAYATARVIVGSEPDAEDAFQEACMRAWRDIHKLKNPGVWQPWFRRVVTNAAIDRARASAKLRRIALESPDASGDPAGPAADRDLIFRAVQTLSPDERALLVLRFGHDLELTDVSKAMGLRLGTVKSKLHRALRKLRERMGETDEY